MKCVVRALNEFLKDEIVHVLKPDLFLLILSAESVDYNRQYSSDCIAFIIMTHGDDGDMLHAKDKIYNLDEMICKKFTATKCPSLGGRPKLFFIQACKGDNRDYGSCVVSDSPGEHDANRNTTYQIPNEADFFLAYATVPGMHISAKRLSYI